MQATSASTTPAIGSFLAEEATAQACVNPCAALFSAVVQYASVLLLFMSMQKFCSDIAVSIIRTVMPRLNLSRESINSIGIRAGQIPALRTCAERIGRN